MVRFVFTVFLLFVAACKPLETENIHLKEFDFIPFTILKELPYEIRETSGLVKDAYTIWTHNDSGNSPVLYQLSSDGDLENKVWIKKGSNTDWEEITTDEKFMYIGDFGNNLGTRRNLRIYKLPLDSLAAMEALTTDTIQFRYPEQTEFPGSYNHNFDCEAFISFKDSLYLFTKNWQDHGCSVYSLPKESGVYNARLVAQFNTKGIITGSSYNKSTGELALIGYNYSGVMDPFIWLFSEFEGSDFFSGKAKRYNLAMKRQTEAIEYLNDSTLVISSEGEIYSKATLFKIPI